MDEIEVKFKRGNKAYIDALPIVDGQLIFNTETGEIFEDVGDKRILTGGNVINALPLTGGTMTGPITLASGDGNGILMPTDANINVEGTADTVLGFSGNDFVIGNRNYGTQIRGMNINIRNTGNSGITLNGVSSGKDYTVLKTKDSRVLFIQPNAAGSVHIGDAINSSTEGDLSAKLIVGGDIKERGKKLSEKYQTIGDYAPRELFNIEYSFNMFNYDTVVVGQLNSAGTITSISEYTTTDFIPIPKSRKIYFYQHQDDYDGGIIKLLTPSQSNGTIVCAYDGAKNFIEGSRKTGYEGNIGSPYIPPENAVYFRWTMSTEWFESSWRTFGLFPREIIAKEYTLWSETQTELKETQWNSVACWGDSLTDGAGSSNGKTYPHRLANYIKSKRVHNYGIGGEGSYGIALRMGAIMAFAQPFTIPAGTTPVNMTLKDETGADIITLLRGGTVPDPNTSNFNINPVIIAGIEGTLAKVSAEYNAEYTFTRTTAGEAVALTRPTFVSFRGFRESLEDITVIWAGTNDNQSWKGIDYVISNIDKMLMTLKNPDYIIIGLTSKNFHSDVEAKNEKLFKKYGNHFLDVRKYILAYGLEDAGISPTKQDTADIASGEIPTSLRSDEVHLNNAGYNIVAKQVYNRGRDLNYWK